MNMEASSGETQNTGFITVHIKTPKNKETVQTAPNATVKEFKELVSQKFNAQPDKICLIFSGKILKDEETLDQLAIKDGLTVHLVIKNNKDSQPKQEPPPSTTPTTQATNSANPAPQNPFGAGLSGLGGMGGLSQLAQNPEFMQQAQQQLIQNPEIMQQLMNTPVIQNIMNNPEQFREFFMSNQQMQSVLERNPEINHVINNPQLMRQAMEIARNPALMQEMMRNQDVALRNIESLPGGHSALRRLYSEVQEPMINAAQETFQPGQTNTPGPGDNPFAALFSQQQQQQQRGTGGTSVPPGTESTNPLPNPWAPPSSTPSSVPSNNNPTMPGGQDSQLQGIFQSPGLQSLMRQMQDNPSLLQSAMQMPQMQEMMQQFSTNPDLMNLLISSNPLLRNDPNLANQIRGQLPNIMSQMQNPEFQAAMTNPEVLSAMMQIQQGMQRLTMAAPGLLPGIGVNPFPQGGTGTPGGGLGGNPSANPAQNNAYMQNLMSQMVNSMNNGSGQTRPQAPPANPEVAYRAQLQQLGQMGFVDAHANLQALISTNGDLNSAIERLLQQRDQMT